MNDVKEQENVVLNMSRKFEATVEKVWDAWTNPDIISKWWLPDGFTEPKPNEVDLTVGGGFKFHMQPPEGDAFYAHGIFKEIIPNKLIKSTWLWSHSDQETLLTIEFKESNGGTELILTHELFMDEAQRDLHSDGWQKCFDRIENLF